MKTRLLRLVIVFVTLGMVTGTLALPSPVQAATYVVNTTDTRIDLGDWPCTLAHCSLWEAVISANVHPGPDRVTFNLPGDGPHIIFLGDLEHPGRTYMEINVWDDETEIDATTQPGWPIYLNGLGEAGWGMIIRSNRNTVRGLGFLGFTESGIEVRGDNNFLDRVIAGEFIGDGLIPGPTANNVGIKLRGDNNTLRGVSVANNITGIWALGSNQVIQDSHIGFIRDGVSRRSNDFGILLEGSGNTIERNTIVGNAYGLMADSNGNTIIRNYIGIDNTDMFLLGNETGILLQNLSGTNRVGGTDTYDGNVIVSNDIGIHIAGPGNLILNNRIGIDFSGASFPNRIGVLMHYGSTGSVLGSGWSDTGNIIANNTQEGVLVASVDQIQIQGNVIHNNGGDGIRLLSDFGPLPADGMKAAIRRNSIYDNGEMGISIPDPSLNNHINHPTGLRFDGRNVSGQACPGCIVEVFQAAADPSGFGEGKTLLSTVYAGSDGSFSAPVSGLGACSEITATATDNLGNTSDFSENAPAIMCFRFTSVMAWIWVLGSAGAGSALLIVIIFLARRPRHLPGPASTVGLGLLGGILGAGIGIGLLALPFVQIQWPQAQSGGQTSPSGPTCGQFLIENLLQPADGAVFTPGTDVLFELSPQPDPPGMQNRWFLDITGPNNTTISKMLSSNSISLFTLGFDPKQTGIYSWKIRGERSKNGSNTWTPLCADSFQHMFRIATPTPLQPTATAMVTPNPSPTVTETSTTPTATLLQNAYCMRGPGAAGYESLTTLFQGVQVPIEGRNQDGTWWYVRAPNSQARCWVAGTMVQTSGNVNGVPVVEAAPPACWVQPPQGPKKCVAPCPEGATPGGACEP